MPPRSKSNAPRVVFARATTALRAPGSKYPTTIHEGQAWYADHPLVQGHPGAFSDEPPVVFPRGWSPPVEQATAAPGETRTTSRGG